MKKIVALLIICSIAAIGGYVGYGVYIKYQSAQSEIAELKETRNDLMERVDDLTAELTMARQKHDTKIKEAGKSVYKEKINMPDSDVGDAWAEYMSGVRQRNSERR